MTDTVTTSQDGAVATITLNRPDALNGFTPEMCGDLLLALETAHNDDSVRVVIITGSGRAFSAGADLKGGLDGERTVHGKLQYEYRLALSAIAEIPKPVIAVVPGFAAGIGMSFVLHSDLIVMADDAFLLSPFTTISLLPDGGATWLMVRKLGYNRAFQLSIESERISAQRCLEYGIANKLFPVDQLQDAAKDWAQALCKRAPLSVAATKKAMRFAQDGHWSDSYNLEAELQNYLKGTADAAEGVDAFLEKREPKFVGK